MLDSVKLAVNTTTQVTTALLVVTVLIYETIYFTTLNLALIKFVRFSDYLASALFWLPFFLVALLAGLAFPKYPNYGEETNEEITARQKTKVWYYALFFLLSVALFSIVLSPIDIPFLIPALPAITGMAIIKLSYYAR